MNFLISNFKFPDAQRFGDIFYHGTGVEIGQNTLAAIASNAIGHSINLLFENTRNLLYEKQLASGAISDTEFYAAIAYKETSNVIFLQTDVVAYESIYLYRKNRTFMLSNDLYRMVDVLSRCERKPVLNETKIRKFLYFGNRITTDTIFDEIILLQPATTYCLDITTFTLGAQCYDPFAFCPTVDNADEAADRLICKMHNVFERNYVSTSKYGIGVSGGLDSRIVAYFAKKAGYDISPFFIGRKRNMFGIITNDAKRAEEVAKKLGLGSINYVDTSQLNFTEKIRLDAKSSLVGSPNAHQNCGYTWPSFQILIHGMMGGEMFGGIAFLRKANINCPAEVLAQSIILSLSGFPKYCVPYSLWGKISTKIPKLRDKYCFSSRQQQRITSSDEQQDVLEELVDWIKLQQEKGLSNVNIMMKHFYYTQANKVRMGYYSTLENNIEAFGGFFNPTIISEFRQWNDSLFFDRIVQKALLIKADNLLEIRDQTVMGCAIDAKQMPIITQVLRTAERIIRGSGMYYKNIKQMEIRDFLAEMKNNSYLMQLIPMDIEQLIASYAGLSTVFLKIVWIEVQYQLKINSGPE